MNKKNNDTSIVVDTMGGDFAPDEIIKGSIEAYKSFASNITLVGDRKKLNLCAIDNNLDISPFTIEESKSEVGMGESPSQVLIDKKDSSRYVLNV